MTPDTANAPETTCGWNSVTWPITIDCCQELSDTPLRRPRDPLFDDMLAMLEELEWAGRDLEPSRDRWFSYCEACGNSAADGHRPDCRLAALLKKAREA
jgi:hypothetical protein